MTTRRSFTLVELLTVIVIIAVLSGLIVGAASYATRRAAEAKTISRLQKLEIALEQYRQDWGYFPQQSASGSATSAPFQFDESAFENPQGVMYLEDYTVDSNGLNDNAYNDAWGRPFHYECPGEMNSEMYDLWSMGQDRKHGEAGSTLSDAQTAAADESDDITNWKRMQ